MTTSHDPLRDLDVTMFPCNTTAIRTWSSFLSRILPLLNRSLEEAQAVTVAVVTGAIQPASHAPSDSNHTEHVFQYTYSEGDVVVQPPAREPVPLPKAVLYLLMAALVVVLVAYAIVGHLVKDLVHEFVEWVVGPRSRNRGSKTDVSCVTGNELSELPSLLETNYITHNHTDRPASSKQEDLVVNLDDPVELHHHPYRVT